MKEFHTPPKYRAALAGTVEQPGATLDARMQAHAVRLPRTGPGRSARFNFDNGRRGWVAQRAARACC